MVALAALAGCGPATEKSFNDNFDKKFMSSCVASAAKRGAPVVVVNQLCDCAIKQIDAKYSIAEKLLLPDDKLRPIITQCVNNVVQKQ